MHKPIAQLHLSVYKPHNLQFVHNRSDKGQMLETSAFKFLYSGQFTLTQLTKPNYIVPRCLENKVVVLLEQATSICVVINKWFYFQVSKNDVERMKV